MRKFSNTFNNVKVPLFVFSIICVLSTIFPRRLEVYSENNATKKSVFQKNQNNKRKMQYVKLFTVPYYLFFLSLLHTFFLYPFFLRL